MIETLAEFAVALTGSYLAGLVVIIPFGLIVCGLVAWVMSWFEKKPSFDDQLLDIVRDFSRRIR